MAKNSPPVAITPAPKRILSNRAVEIPVQTVKGLLTPQYSECVAEVDYVFYNHGQNVTWLTVVNLGQLPVVVEFMPVHPDYEPIGYEVAAGVSEIGPFAADLYNDPQFNRAAFTVSGPVNVACKRLGL